MLKTIQYTLFPIVLATIPAPNRATYNLSLSSLRLQKLRDVRRFCAEELRGREGSATLPKEISAT
jgi:hypothetical protein